MMKTTVVMPSLGGVAAGLVAGMISTQAELLVYEPFDYPPNEILTDRGGARGTTGTWVTHDTITGDGKTQDWFVHAEGTLSGVGLSGQNPSAEPLGMHQWDGTVENLATAGGYAGLWGADDWNDDDPNAGEPGRNLDASIGLDPAVTATFQPGTTTWFSYVAVRGWDRNEETPSLMLCSDPTPNDSRAASVTNGGSGFGTGGGPPRNNRPHIYPMFFQGGEPYNVIGKVNGWRDDSFTVPEDGRMDWLEVGADNLFGPVNIVVGKIEWDADTDGKDILSVARFLETDTLSEEAFDAFIAEKPNLSTANWDDANKPDLDQGEFDTLNIAGLKFFVDEIRIGTTFKDVTPGKAPPVPPAIVIVDNGPDLEVSWESRPGMYYVLRSSSDLEAELSTWGAVDVPGSVEVDGVFRIAHTAPENRHTIPRPGDEVRFYRVEEYRLPPITLLAENFDGTNAGELPAGWTRGFDPADTQKNTAWELGNPNGGPLTAPTEAVSGPNCVGTNLLANYGTASNTWLRSPPIDLGGARAATVSFQQWVDVDEFLDLDYGTLRVLASANLAELAVLEPTVNGLTLTGWEDYRVDLPEAVLGQSVVLEFGFVSDSDGAFDAAGWYLDDLLVIRPAE